MAAAHTTGLPIPDIGYGTFDLNVRFPSRLWKNGFGTFIWLRRIESMRVERRDQARIASRSGLTPKIWIILFML